MLIQGTQQPMLDIPVPRGIYKPDFATCNAADRDMYQAIFPGYLSITSKEFSVSLLTGTWKRTGEQLNLKVGSFGAFQFAPNRKFSSQTLLDGLAMDILPSGDLVLKPAPGMVMKTSLVFRREPAMKLVDALQQTFHMMDGEISREVEFTLPYKISEQIYDLQSSLKAELLDIVESDRAIEIRTEAAFFLVGTKGDDLVRRTGNLLLSTEPTKERNLRILQNALAAVLGSSHHPASLQYALAAKRKGIFGKYQFSEVLANCGDPEAIDVIAKEAKTADDSYLVLLFKSMRKLSSKRAMELAKEYEGRKDPMVHFEVIRTWAEASPMAKDRERAIRTLVDMFPKVNWMMQCDIAKSLGEANVPVAKRYLQKISGKGADPAVQQWINMAIQKYKS